VTTTKSVPRSRRSIRTSSTVFVLTASTAGGCDLSTMVRPLFSLRAPSCLCRARGTATCLAGERTRREYTGFTCRLLLPYPWCCVAPSCCFWWRLHLVYITVAAVKSVLARLERNAMVASHPGNSPACACTEFPVVCCESSPSGVTCSSGGRNSCRHELSSSHFVRFRTSRIFDEPDVRILWGFFLRLPVFARHENDLNELPGGKVRRVGQHAIYLRARGTARTTQRAPCQADRTSAGAPPGTPSRRR
jgi:hypothetical protein